MGAAWSTLARIAACGLFASAANAQIITTIAGTDYSFPAPSLPALNAPLGQLYGIAVDAGGNVFIADTSDNLIMRVSVSGTLTVFAGNGIAGFSGDGGPATSASLHLSAPGSFGGGGGMAVDPAGNVYIADSVNNRIRKVSGGTITTVAGGGGSLGDGGPATSASLEYPTAVALDSAGNLYIVDLDHQRVRKVSGGTVTTVAGNGTPGFSGDGGPATSASLFFVEYGGGVAVDSAGNIYIADSANNRIRKVSGGTITTVAGGGSGFNGTGPATGASLFFPLGVAVDSAGNLYIADTFDNLIHKVTNGTISTVAGNGTDGFSGDGGPPTAAQLYSPSAVAVDSAGNIYIADTLNERLRKVSNGTITTVAGTGAGSYRFSGDGGPATNASLNYPDGVAVDAPGNIYIADALNNRIRKVSNGTISTVAGNGAVGFSGDGGPATGASLELSLLGNIGGGVTVDAIGTIYIADSFNTDIRKVSNGAISSLIPGQQIRFPEGLAVDSAGDLYIAATSSSLIQEVAGGTITTVAGNGHSAFSGDGGSATSASLFYPEGVALDSAGNIYIADSANNRVRKVSNGTITTVAGNGTAGFSGDGGPATSATLTPNGVAVDSAGDLYIADRFSNRIRKVSNGTITTVAGNGTAAFSGDGGLATNASLNLAPPGSHLPGGLASGIAVDAAGNLYIADSGNNRIREVLVNPFFRNPVAEGAGSLSLTQASGGKPVTATLNADITTTANSSIAVPGMEYSASVTAGSSWLSVSPQSGSTPGLISVTANPLSLPQGGYNGTIQISVPLAYPQIQTVSVAFTVTAAIPPTLSLDQSHMSFTYATTSTVRSQTLIVSNTGGGSLNFSTSIVLKSGISANWLSVTPQNGTATPGNPVALGVRADPSVLPPGTYTANLTVNGGAAGAATIPITMTITTNPLVMLLSQAGLTFTVVQNGGATPPQTFGVLNLGSGILNWTVQTSTLQGGNWLIATPPGGSSTSADLNGAPLVSVSVNPAGLAPGVYYGLVKVISGGAANTPQEVVAVLQVLPPRSDLAPIVQPTSLIFTAPAGVSSPSSQNVLVYDPTGTGKSFSSTASGAGSLVTLPTDATIPPTEPVQVVVQPVVNGLAPGTYPGTLTLQFSDGRLSAVGITFVVTSAAGATSENSHAIPHDAGACVPTKLIPVLTTLGSGFTVPAGFPEGLTAQISDDCGNPLTQGQVSVEFSTGQGLKYMQSLNNGRWDVTWNTGSQQASSVTLTVQATDPTQTLTGQSLINGALGAPQAPPQVSDHGVVSSATFAATPVAPGGFISIFGSLLSDATSSAPVLPLPTTLNNTTVSLGDQTLPLFYTNTGNSVTPAQLNALVPYETNLNTNQQLLVQRDNTYATPVYVDVAAAQPGVIEYGTQQAVAVDASGNLIGPSNPTHAGDVVVMYCLGLGVVSPAVADGAAAPSDPLASTVNPVTLTVGGQTATVIFAGLTPTLVGLYQINFRVPQGAGTGDQVPVVVSTGGQTSGAVNLSVR